MSLERNGIEIIQPSYTFPLRPDSLPSVFVCHAQLTGSSVLVLVDLGLNALKDRLSSPWLLKVGLPFEFQIVLRSFHP